MDDSLKFKRDLIAETVREVIKHSHGEGNQVLVRKQYCCSISLDYFFNRRSLSDEASAH
jgi:hypothetical protein